MKFNSLQDLLVHELRDLYAAENQLVKALPKMAKGAKNPALQAGFNEHYEQTRGHAQRLEQIFKKLNVSPSGVSCDAMEGLVEEGSDLLSAGGDDATRDAGLICAAQKVEHYEIASYGTVRTWARQLGLHDVADLLEQTLNEEKETDDKLNHIAESMVNMQATSAAH